MERTIQKFSISFFGALLLLAVMLFPVSVSAVCEYLDTPVIAGEVNDSGAVTKIQYFLATEEGLEVEITGVYDAQTVRAVGDFQIKYASDILTPWGLTQPTGNVSVTTMHKINEVYCGEQPLTSEEIDGMREVQEKYGVIQEEEATTSSSTLNIIADIAGGQDGRLGGTPIGFVHEFSLPIVIMLVVLMATQTFFMWGVAPRRRMLLIPREFK